MTKTAARKPVKARPVVLLALPDGNYRARRPGGERHTLRLTRQGWACDCLGYWHRRRCAHADAANLALREDE